MRLKQFESRFDLQIGLELQQDPETFREFHLSLETGRVVTELLLPLEAS